MKVHAVADGLRWIAGFIVIATCHATMNAEPIRSLDHFESGGKQVRVETFAAPKHANAPSVIVLHGATGVEFANRFIAGLAASIAEEGFVVHLVHYFDRTGARYADDATIKSSSDHWLATVHDAVTFVRGKRPAVKIGVFGYSLGGYLAAAETVGHREIAAAVILAGGLDEGSARIARHAAPVLILHGAADRRVPISEARRLEKVLRHLGNTPEFHVYPGEGHIMSLAAYADVLQRSVDFFRVHLSR